MAELRSSDLAAVREQLGREPTTRFSVVARCPGGHPLVIRNHPLDADGNPSPTPYRLTCVDAGSRAAPLAPQAWIARLATESARQLERAHPASPLARARHRPH